MKNLKNYFFVIISIFCFGLFVCANLILANSLPNIYAENELTGEGTKENPYIIQSVDDLMKTRDNVNAGISNYSSSYYKLEKNLNISNVEIWEPIGTETNPFSGIFDGNGKVIEGINLTEKYLDLGLFGVINGAQVFNLGIASNIIITKSTTNEQEDVKAGGIVGRSFNSSIYGCYSQVNFKANYIQREQENAVNKFMEKIEGTQKISLANINVASVFDLAGNQQSSVYKIENNYLSFNSVGLWKAQITTLSSINQIYLVDVTEENNADFYLKESKLPENIEEISIINSNENDIFVVENGKIEFLKAGEFKLSINGFIYYVLVKENDAVLNYEAYKTASNNVVLTNNYQTFKYSDRIVFGGIAGEISDSEIYNSYSIPKISFSQENKNTEKSYLGGIAGIANGGEIYNVYVAPTDELISEIILKNGNINAISYAYAPIKINSSVLNSLSFGGVVGFAKGATLKINNTMFFSLISTLNSNNLLTGGIIGEVSSNETFLIQEFKYGKYLNLSESTNILTFESSLGNALDVGYQVHSTVKSVAEIPTQKTFNSWEWNEFRAWDFDNIWKTTSIYPQLGYFFPSLQNFAVIEISIFGKKEVNLTQNGNYLSGFYTLQIEGVQGKKAEFNVGQKVTLIAKFYSEQENQLRNFKNYFKFTDWLKNEYSVISFTEGLNNYSNSQYIVELDEINGITKITFTASSQTEGLYDVNVKGKPVKVNINFINQESMQNQENMGIIKAKISGKEEAYYNNFSFTIAEYLNGETVTLTAENIPNHQYIFANKWEDENNKNQSLNQNSVLIELNNENKTSSRKFYPLVVLSDNQLVSNINVYYSNNTCTLSVTIEGEGKVELNGNTQSQSFAENVVKNNTVLLKATPESEMKFVGWFDGEKLLSENEELELLISNSKTIVAKFEKVPNENTGLAPWIIGMIVVGSIIFISVAIVVTIVIVKKRTIKSYKKNYRF